MGQADSGVISYRDWHVPITHSTHTLTSALDSLSRVGAMPGEIPLLIQIMENPRFNIAGKTLFHGAVDLHQHDCIHVVLGRGLLPKDEAFTIGFTMGSTHRVGTAEEKLFAVIAQHFYPPPYRFTEEDVAVFMDAVKLGSISRCQPLDTVTFDDYLSLPLNELRQALQIEPELLAAYYAVEANRYPDSPESQRLLHTNDRTGKSF